MWSTRDKKTRVRALPVSPLPKVLEAGRETFPGASFQAGEEPAVNPGGRMVAWVERKTASQVTTHSLLCDQGHLRTVETKCRWGLLFCSAEECQENSIWRENAWPTSLPK